MEITVEEAIKYLESEYECAKCILLNKKGSCSDECVKVKNGELESQEDREKLLESYEMALKLLKHAEWIEKVEIRDATVEEHNSVKLYIDKMGKHVANFYDFIEEVAKDE